MMPLAGLLLSSQLVVAVADRVPQFDFMPSCRGATAGGFGTLDSCATREKAARDQLTKDWSQFASADRSVCSEGTKQFSPSYVELLSCLQMYADVKKLRDGETVGQPAKKR
jgi:hypothetical protein